METVPGRRSASSGQAESGYANHGRGRKIMTPEEGEELSKMRLSMESEKYETAEHSA